MNAFGCGGASAGLVSRICGSGGACGGWEISHSDTRPLNLSYTLNFTIMSGKVGVKDKRGEKLGKYYSLGEIVGEILFIINQVESISKGLG